MAELRIEDAVDALMVEQALVMSRELKRSCQSAPHGQVLAAAEQVAVAQARELARRGLEAALTAQRDEVEKKGLRPLLPLWPVSRAPGGTRAERADGHGALRSPRR